LICTFANEEALSQGMAEQFASSAEQAIAERGRFAVALSGGHTPTRAYRLLTAEPYVGRIDWSKVHIFWGDERNVPNTDPNSNERMALESLLSGILISSENIHPMFNGSTNVAAAAAYEAILRSFFGDNGPLFDMVMLGMGPDGHTLSLFPGAGNLDSSAWVIPAQTDVWAVHDRITLTPRAVSMSRQVVLEIGGADKAEMVKAILEENADYPLGVVVRGCEDVVWLLDEPAAALLTQK
jgi:6-phosphogluconolactonase